MLRPLEMGISDHHMISRIVLLNPPILVLSGIVTSAAAQIFLKIGSSYRILEFKWLLYLFLSLFSYALAFMAYYLALKHYDISKISPIMMASIVSIVAIYGFLAGESINFLKLLGIVTAIVSVVLLSAS